MINFLFKFWNGFKNRIKFSDRFMTLILNLSLIGLKYEIVILSFFIFTHRIYVYIIPFIKNTVYHYS